MFLKNYTSDVPIGITINRIRATLIKCGVSGITEEYGKEPGQILALTFHVKLDRVYTIRLPANVKSAQDALWMDYVGDDNLSADKNSVWGNGYKKKKKSDFLQQAERTAWKLQQDWIEVQMSMIQLKQAEFLQVFVSYIYDERTQMTFFDKYIKDKNFLALPAPSP